MGKKYLQIGTAFLCGLVICSLLIQKAGSGGFAQASTDAQTQSTAPVEQIVHTDTIWFFDAATGVGKIDLETYLIGVLLAEMPTSFEMEALQAQAVAARTYALKQQKENRHISGAVCTDAGCCQAYVAVEDYLNDLGYPEDVDKAREAIQSTKGLVLTYNDALIEATYFHGSGGRTEPAVAVWGVDYPYLQATDSPGEEVMEHYEGEVFYTQAELEALLSRKLTGTPDSWVGLASYTAGGGVDSISICDVIYGGTELRSLLKLNSTKFTISSEPDGLRITTLGKGHRVGMSQCGAQAMALQGSTYQEILYHYYSGTRIDKIDEVG